MFFIFINIFIINIFFNNFFFLALPTSTSRASRKYSHAKSHAGKQSYKNAIFFIYFSLSKERVFLFSYILTSIFSQFSLRGNNLFDEAYLPPKERVNILFSILFCVSRCGCSQGGRHCIFTVAFGHRWRRMPREPWRCYLSKYKFVLFFLYIYS